MRYLFMLILCLTCWQTQAQTNTLQEAFDKVVPEIREVEANGRSFEQKLSQPDAEYPSEILFETTITEKNGKSNSEQFEFNLIDFNTKLLRREVRSKVMFLVVKADKNQRMIKYYKNGEQENYQNQFYIAVNDAEEYRQLSEAFEALIKAAQKSKEMDYSTMDFSQQIQFLQEQISTVEVGEESHEQSLSSGTPAYLLTLQNKVIKSKGNEDYRQLFNLADLGEKSVKVKVTGKRLMVVMNIKGNHRWVQNFKDDEFDSYNNNLEILVNTTRQARQITSVLKVLIPEARRMEEESRKALASESTQQLEQLLAYVKDVENNSNSLTQKLSGECLLELSQEKTVGKDKSTKEVFSFNLIDFDPKNTSIESSSNSLSVRIKSKKKMVQYLRDGEVQSYRNSIDIYANDVEDAKTLAFLLAEQISTCLEANEAVNLENQSKEELFASATDLILDVEMSSYSYLQKLETEEGETCKLQFTQTKSTKNKDIEVLYDFSLSDIDPKTIDFVISGRNLSFEIATRNREKVIKEYEGDDRSNYTNRFQVYMDDLEKARQLISLLSELTTRCQNEGG